MSEPVGYARAEKEFCAYKLIEWVQPWLIKVTACVQSGEVFADVKIGTSSMEAECKICPQRRERKSVVVGEKFVDAGGEIRCYEASSRSVVLLWRDAPLKFSSHVAARIMTRAPIYLRNRPGAFTQTQPATTRYQLYYTHLSTSRFENG
jgi:hypothetical protein